TPELFVRERCGAFGSCPDESELKSAEVTGPNLNFEAARIGNTTLFHADCVEWIARQNDNTIHAVVTDPPYGLDEYSPEQQKKLRAGKGGVWRIPPSFDGHVRSPLPRFTTLTPAQLDQLYSFF